MLSTSFFSFKSFFFILSSDKDFNATSTISQQKLHIAPKQDENKIITEKEINEDYVSILPSLYHHMFN
jgi:hypothetical protein